ncbi:MAG: hypothetical protein LBD22_05305 [Spirochaetaceae bacterium]|jgi:hypothetical protein|nr:hypothetical protein [Spirochaetaceae bacterium]
MKKILVALKSLNLGRFSKIGAVAILVLLWGIALIPRIYWFTQKDALHNDEVTTVLYAEYNELGWIRHFPQQIPFSGKQIKEAFLMTDGAVKDIFSDIGKLWQDTRDSFHTNLYFSLFRIALGTLQSGNFKDAIFRGAILNLILFSISFFMFFLLLRLLFKQSKFLPYLAVFCTFMSTATISNTILLRPYQLQEAMFVVLSYFLIKFLSRDKIAVLENKKKYLSLSFFFIMTIMTGLTLDSAFFSILFVAFIGIYALGYCVYTKRFRDIGAYFIIVVCALMFAQTINQKYLGNLFGNVAAALNWKTEVATANSASSASASDISGSANLGTAASGEMIVSIDASAQGDMAVSAEASATLEEPPRITTFEDQLNSIYKIPTFTTLMGHFYTYYWTLPVLIVSLLILCFAIMYFLERIKKKEGGETEQVPKPDWRKMVLDFIFSPYFGLTVCAFLFIVFSVFLAIFKELRYGIAMYPFMIILPIFLLNSIQDKRIIYAMGIALAISFSATAFNESKIPYIWRGYPEKLYRFAAEPKIPAFIICTTNHYPLILPYLADDQIYIFDTNIYTAFEKFQFDEFFLIMNDPIINDNIIDSKIWEIKEAYKVGVNIGLWTVGKLKRLVPAAVPITIENGS